jgi:hypothetical protein
VFGAASDVDGGVARVQKFADFEADTTVSTSDDANLSEWQKSEYVDIGDCGRCVRGPSYLAREVR